MPEQCRILPAGAIKDTGQPGRLPSLRHGDSPLRECLLPPVPAESLPTLPPSFPPFPSCLTNLLTLTLLAGCACDFNFRITQTREQSHTHTHARTHARTHSRKHVRTHARARARTHARTHVHTHRHTHTHTLSLSLH